MSARMISVVAGAVLLTIASSGHAGNPLRGQQLAAAVCASCHGADGNMALADDYPILAGQHASYLEFALRAYRSGDRDNAIMSPFASELSDQDIRDLAAWYSRQQGLFDTPIR